MTILQFEDEEELAPPAGLRVKCGWCGEVSRLDGNELAVTMCQTCYDGMLADFTRAAQANKSPSGR
jgi:hypothetical protein